MVERLENSPLSFRILNQEDADYLYRNNPNIPKNSASGCPSCGKNNGYGVDGILELDGVKVMCNCKDQLQRMKHYTCAGIGANYQFLGWSHFVGDQDAKSKCMEYVDRLDENVAEGKGLILQSEAFGVGKTMLASLIAKEGVMAGHQTYFTTFPMMLSSMKAGWKDADWDKWYRHKIDSAQILVIDDVGKELMGRGGFNDDFARQTLDSLIRVRTQQGKTTIVTTNLDNGSFKDAYGSPMYSLIFEQNDKVKMSGEDFRVKKPKQVVGYRRIY